MGQTTDTAMIADLRKELEREAEEENIPILRRAETVSYTHLTLPTT